MKLLLDVMARPDFDERSQLAMSGIGGMFASTEAKLALGAGDGEEFLGRAARGSKAVQPSGDGGEPVALGVRADTPNGLSLALALDTRPGPQELQRWTVLAALPTRRGMLRPRAMRPGGRTGCSGPTSPS